MRHSILITRKRKNILVLGSVRLDNNGSSGVGGYNSQVVDLSSDLVDDVSKYFGKGAKSKTSMETGDRMNPVGDRNQSLRKIPKSIGGALSLTRSRRFSFSSAFS